MNIETANRLLQFRKKHGLSQEQLAAEIGVSRQAVSKWERAEASPDTDNLILLAQIYGVTLDELLTGNCENEKSEESSQDSADTEPVSDNSNGGNANAEQTGSKSTGDRVYFDNGLHIDAKNGDRVHVGFGGVHVDTHDGTKVSVDKNGVFVDEKGECKAYTDEHGHVFYDDNHHKKSLWYKFPYPVVAVVIMLVWGFADVLGGFAYSWLSFLTIPLYYTLVDAIIKRKASHFAYPVLAVLLFFVWGFYFPQFGGFAVAWIIFLTIPIYYFICNAINRKN